MKKLSFLLVIGLMLGACSEEEATEPIEQEEVAEETADVEMDATAEVSDGKVTILGTTNLPDGGELMFTVANPETDYRAQSKNIIENGEFSSDTFSDQGEALTPGEYSVAITLSIASTQSDEFVEQTGEDYENLSGDLVEDSDLGKTVRYETEFTIE